VKIAVESLQLIKSIKCCVYTKRFWGFDNQERNLTFVKTAFQVLKLKFLACIMEKVYTILFTNKIFRELGNKKVVFYNLSVRYLVVKPSCVNAAKGNIGSFSLLSHCKLKCLNHDV